MQDVGEVDDGFGVPQVGLIRGVEAHGLIVGHPFQGLGNLDADLLKGLPDNPFREGHHIVFLDEAHLDVHLGELGLTVGPQVLVSKAAGHLEVAVEAGDHEDLFEELGGLGEGVEGSFPEPGGDEEVPGPLGGGLDENGGLDLVEALGIEEATDPEGRPMAEGDVVLESLLAEVEEAVLQPGLLGGFQLVRGVEGEVLHGAQNLEGVGLYFDGPGLELRVGGLPGDHGAVNGDDGFALQGLHLG